MIAPVVTGSRVVAGVVRLDLARPEGAGRALATYRIPIEGRDEWIPAARRLA